MADEQPAVLWWALLCISGVGVARERIDVVEVAEEADGGAVAPRVALNDMRAAVIVSAQSTNSLFLTSPAASLLRNPNCSCPSPGS